MSLLTRELIGSDAYLTHFDSLPREILWSRERIEKSLAETMRVRSPSSDVWIFGYGSLIWNPLLNFDRRQGASLQGWHRSFCLRMIAGRGSAQAPGRMLALEPGGATSGVAFRLAEPTIETELRLVWAREMPTGVYHPTWSTITLADGQVAAAITFVADPSHPLHEKDTCVATVAPLIATAAGSLGSNADYVFRLRSALAANGVTDAYVDTLADEVARLSPTQPASAGPTLP
jgi:cation transport protein ChaC